VFRSREDHTFVHANSTVPAGHRAVKLRPASALTQLRSSSEFPRRPDRWRRRYYLECGYTNGQPRTQVARACLSYQGNNWPPEYRGKAYTLNLHGHRINSDTFERESVDYVAHYGEDMCVIEDPWFRGIDLINRADGGVFIADSSDNGECHEIGGVYRTSDRIYKVDCSP
jgi:hypothetical protein